MLLQDIFPILFLDLVFCCVFGFLFLEAGVFSVLSFQKKHTRLFACLDLVLFICSFSRFVLFILIFVGLSSLSRNKPQNPRTRKNAT